MHGGKVQHSLSDQVNWSLKPECPPVKCVHMILFLQQNRISKDACVSLSSVTKKTCSATL